MLLLQVESHSALFFQSCHTVCLAMRDLQVSYAFLTPLEFFKLASAGILQFTLVEIQKQHKIKNIGFWEKFYQNAKKIIIFFSFCGVFAYFAWQRSFS